MTCLVLIDLKRMAIKRAMVIFRFSYLYSFVIINIVVYAGFIQLFISN